MVGDIFIEENGVYQLDCTTALWATDKIHAHYHASGTFLSDVDFVAETSDFLYLIEYKNANIPNAANPTAFVPERPDKVDNAARKFYDSLHYLIMNKKDKRVKYVYVVEYPHTGLTDRKMLRNKIADRLPFKLQTGAPSPIIFDFDVVSISEWNNHDEYSAFPLSPVV